MIAGYKAGEVDFATDLQDSDIPKVQDLGDQVSPIPALTYEFLRPNWSDVDASTRPRAPAAARATRRSRIAAPGCPMADPAMRQAVAYAVDKNAINTRLLGGTVQVANTLVSPGRLVLRRPDADHLRSREGEVRSSTPPAGCRAPTASASRTA